MLQPNYMDRATEMLRHLEAAWEESQRPVRLRWTVARQGELEKEIAELKRLHTEVKAEVGVHRAEIEKLATDDSEVRNNHDALPFEVAAEDVHALLGAIATGERKMHELEGDVLVLEKVLECLKLRKDDWSAREIHNGSKNQPEDVY